MVVERAATHPQAAWEAYFGALLATAAEARLQGGAEDVRLAEAIEQMVTTERAALHDFLDHATLVARRPGAL